ncbi:MAG: adenine deaminase [Deltaproteobacteria bacterium]|nr:adenine deaminase [Deltaproteobacteria bacterium]
MSHRKKTVSGNIVDVVNAETYPGRLKISDGKIVEISRGETSYETYIIPGFVDSHVHIESSMLTPSEFARAAVIHGTVAVVSDPHEVANVMGMDGVKYMIEDGKTVPMKFYFSAPSCVPATPFETSGAVLDAEGVDELLKLDDIRYLGEVMNYPGVIYNDPEVMKKIASAKKHSKLIDGHAPGLRGSDLTTYVRAGISTNHEFLSKEEALEDIQAGMKILIRKGSAADIFEECIPLLKKYPESCMLCADDKHPDDLLKGYLNDMVRQALTYGIDIMKILRVASVNPVLHYGLDVGLLRVGDPADFLEIDSLDNVRVLKTYINGEVVAEEGASLIPKRQPRILNNFNTKKKTTDDFALPSSAGMANIIGALDGRLITEKLIEHPRIENGCAVSDVDRDILKITVVNRYRDSQPAVGFIQNFNLTHGAIASSVAHDSHNIIAIGVTDEDLCRAVNLIIDTKGGICAVSGDQEKILPLPIAGIMSDKDCETVAADYTAVDAMAKSMGSKLRAPFMTLSFMALPVIPKLKLTDRGLFDGEKFEFIDLFE